MLRSLRSLIVLPIVLLAGIVMLVIGFQESANAKKLAAEGVTVPAKAIDHEVNSGRRGRKTYKITATYQPKEGGPLQSKTFRVKKDAFDASQSGEPITVRYLPSNPTISLVTGDTGDGSENIFAGGFMAVIGVGGLGWRILRRGND